MVNSFGLCSIWAMAIEAICVFQGHVQWSNLTTAIGHGENSRVPWSVPYLCLLSSVVTVAVGTTHRLPCNHQGGHTSDNISNYMGKHNKVT